MMNFQGSCLGKGSQEGNLSVEMCSREFFFKHALAHRMLYGLSSYKKNSYICVKMRKIEKKLELGLLIGQRTVDSFCWMRIF